LCRPILKQDRALFLYLINTIIYHCAPTILELKPASLINFNQTNQLYLPWRRYSINCLDSLTAKFNCNINFYEIRHQLGCQSLILFYNPKFLSESLLHQDNRLFLNSLGYNPTNNIINYLELMSKNFKTTCPHEVGVFLGIPLNDVKSFIKNQGKNYIFNQYWKVYHNPKSAKKNFAAFDRAKMICFKKT
jgi:hypothetical protein